MIGFDSIAIIDWSSGNDTGARPRKDAIWAGAVLGGIEIDPVYLRNRTEAVRWIGTLIETETAANRRLMIGFDFPFGYPKGFAQAITGTSDPLTLWDYFATNLEDTPFQNNRFALAGAINAQFPGIGPFWFNGTKTDVPHLPRKGSQRTFDQGLPDRRQAEIQAKGSFSCWQMGGAGAVGGQVMTGMAALAQLRRQFPDQIAAWPFEPLDRPVAFFEIWPSLIRKAVTAAQDPIKDRAQVQLLARVLAQLPDATLQKMADINAPEEGWILGIGYENQLEDTLCPA